MSVYFILEEDTAGRRMKIGRAKNITARRRALQTGNSRPLKLVGWIAADDDKAFEARLHAKYAERNTRKDGGNSSKEWFHLEPADILDDLMRARDTGFVAKNIDAFEIVGYDKDAVPEHRGVWDWASLELEECCPFCGCFCGMYFQEASWMYHCINCDTLTNFSDGRSSDRDIA
jgi:hypothetical protein